MSYIAFAWIASITFGFETIVAKLTSKHAISNPYLFTFLWNLFVLIFTFPISLYYGAGFPTQWMDLLLATLFGTGASLLYIITLQKLDVSVFSPLFNFRTVISVVLGALFLGEILTFWQYALITLIFVFGIFASMNERLSIRSFFKWPIALGLTDMLFLSLMSIFINRTLAVIHFWTATLWMAILTLVFLLPTIPLFKSDIKKISPVQLKATGLLGFLSTLGIFASEKEQGNNVSISTVIISLPLSMIMAFLFSVFAPQLLEKHTYKIYAIRFVSALIMLIAALKLSN